MSKQIVGIDISDWRDRCLQEEVTILSEDDIIHLVVDNDYKTGQVGTFAIVLREIGASPDDVLKPNKLLLYAGARSNVNQIIASRKQEVDLENGRTFTIREFLGLGRDEEDGQRFVSFDSKQAIARAMSYIINTVPGHIFERLKQIAAVGGDVRGTASLLHAKIDEMVDMLE